MIVFKLKAAITERLLFMVREQTEEVPVQAPDHPPKVEPASGVAVKVTIVPALNVFPAGVLAIDPVPVPFLLILNAYRGEPLWITVKICPPMVRVPVLTVGSELGWTEKLTLPFPDPLFPERMEIQPVLAETLQEHPDGAFNATVPVPPLELKVLPVGEMVKEQEAP